ncbi:uncharacterized protein Dwil_GK27616, partial [Drosophila willistoni]
AFNSAEWSRIMGSLASFGVQGNLLHIVDSYFTNRRLRYSTVDGLEEYSISAGVPQGSVLCPLLWNSMFDGVLRLNFDPGTRIFRFADDIAVVVTEKELAVAEQKCNNSIATIGRWLAVAGLELAAHKTEAPVYGKKYEANMWLDGSNDGRNLRRAVGLTALSQTYNSG